MDVGAVDIHLEMKENASFGASHLEYSDIKRMMNYSSYGSPYSLDSPDNPHNTATLLCH